MAYLRHYQMRGDPGIFGFLAKGVKGLVSHVLPSVPGVGPVAGAIGKFGGKLAKMPKAGKIALGAGALGGGALGAAALGHALGAHGGRRHRRMNPGNVRALRRSMRRVQSFAHLAQKTISFTHRVHMKKRRKR